MPCVYTWPSYNFEKDGDWPEPNYKESNCTNKFTDQDHDDSASSAKLSPWAIAWFKYGDKQDCFYNLSGSTTSSVKRCSGQWNGQSANLSNLSNVDKSDGGTWNNDIEQVKVDYLRSKESVCLNGSTPRHISKAAYSCDSWFKDNKTKVVNYCNADLPGRMDRDPCKWLARTDPVKFKELQAGHCAKPIRTCIRYKTAQTTTGTGTTPQEIFGDRFGLPRAAECEQYSNVPTNIKSTLCKNWMKETGAPQATYDRAWYDYCKVTNNFTNEDCLNYIQTLNPNSSYRRQFDTLWNRYCATSAGKRDKKCSCYDGDPKWAGQAFCFKPECSRSGYRSVNMERTDCASVCQSIVAGTAGNDATLRDIDVQINCQKKGIDVRPPPPKEPPVTEPPVPGLPPTLGPPLAPPPPGLIPRIIYIVRSYMTIGNLLIAIGAIALIIVGILFYFAPGRYKAAPGVVFVGALALIIVGIILKIRARRNVEPFQDGLDLSALMQATQSTAQSATQDILREIYDIDETGEPTVTEPPAEPVVAESTVAEPVPVEPVPQEEEMVAGEPDKRADLFGKQYRLKSIIKDKYFSLCQECNSTCKDTLCLKESPGPNSVFEFEGVPESDKVVVKSLGNGLYWTLCEKCFVNCPYSVCSNGVMIGYAPSQFEVVLGSDDEIYLKGNNGLYLRNVECPNPCTVEPDDILACNGEEPDRYALIVLEIEGEP